MTYISHAGNESPVSDEMISLLVCWAVYTGIGGNRRAIALLTGQINCSPGAQWMKDALNQSGELDLNDKVSYQIVYSDACMLHVSCLIRNMPKKLRKIVHARYVWYEGLSTKDKAKRLHIDRRTFYRRLDRAHQVINEAMDWKLTR